MRLIGWIIGAAVLSTPVYGMVQGLAGYEHVRLFLGLAEEGPVLERKWEAALAMVPVLLIGAVVWQIVMSVKARRRPTLISTLQRALIASVALVLVGFVATRMLTFIGLDRHALGLGPLLGVGVPLLLRLRRAFARRPVTPAVGDIWWADIPFEEVAESKDRPCLILEVNDGRAIVLMITSQDKAGRSGYLPIDGRGWSAGDKRSWLKIDRLINIRSSDFRRYAGRCPAETLALVEQELSSSERRAPGASALDAPAPAAPAEHVPLPFIPASPSESWR